MTSKPEGDLVASLAASLQGGRFCPVLGSGAMHDLGIPTWRELIGRLALSCGLVPPKAGTRRISSGERIRGVIGDHELSHLYDLLDLDTGRVQENLCRVIYEGRTEPAKAKTKTKDEEIIPPDAPACAWPRNKDDAPRTIAMKGREGADGPKLLDAYTIEYLAILACFTALSAEHRSFHALTYNVDTCLEEEIASLGHDAEAYLFLRSGREMRLRWKARADAQPKVWSRMLRQWERPFTVRIFHPHGVVFRKAAGRALAGEDAPIEIEELTEKGAWRPQSFERNPHELGLVFGKTHYNQLFGSVDDARNRPQLAAFTRLRCLFYGFSFADPNVDRLLEMAAQLYKETDRTEPEHRTAEALAEHLALAKAPAGISLTRPTAEGWSSKVDLRFREAQRRRQKLGTRTHFLPTHNHQKRFLVELIRRIAEAQDYQWPGRYLPKHKRLSG